MSKKKDKRKGQGGFDDESNLQDLIQREYQGEGTYTGQIVRGIRVGTGTLRERNGSILYEGEWKNDKPCGYGKKYFPRTGDRHEGTYVNGERHGLGIYLWKNGDKYSGDWDNGLMHGRGRFEWAATGEVYNGAWAKGKMTGEGIKISFDGSRAQGAFTNGVLDGWAEKVFAEGDKYTGNFKNNSREGYGEYVWTDGRSYKGQWQNDHMHGTGVLVTTTDAVSGSITHRRPGNDFSWMESVLSYSGQFKQGSLEGHGTAVMFDGSKYTGEWKADRFEGWGRVEYSDNSIYEGELHAGEREGQGQLLHHMTAHGTPLPAPPAQAQAPGQPVIFEAPHEDFDAAALGSTVSVESVLNTWGGIYMGHWHCDQPHGMGILELRNGQIFQGEFAHGKIHAIA